MDAADQNQRARQIVQKYFADYPRALTGDDYLFLTPRWLLKTDFIPVTPYQEKHKGENITARVNKIERIIRQLLSEYEQLPFQARMGNKAEMSIYRLYHDFTGEAPRDIQTVDGEPWFPEKLGHLAACREKLSNIHAMHHHQRDNEFAEKVSLIRAARDHWHKWTGKEAPLKASKGRYVDFVGDLIEMCSKEEEWTVEETMNAYARYVKGEGNQLKT